MKILLVEDNQADVSSLREAFSESRANVELEVAEDGDGALATLESCAAHQLPHLILLDLGLPGKSGKEVLVEIRGNQLLRGIPIIVLTSSVNGKDINDVYDRHANCCLTKPGTFDGYLALAEGIDRFWARIASLPRRPSPLF